MKFSSSQDIMFNKPPVSWSKDPEEDEKNVDSKPKGKSDPLISKVQDQRAELEKTAAEPKQKVQKGSGLNKALQPRSGATTQAKTGTKTMKESKPSPMSLGQFISSRKEGASLMGKKSDNKPVPLPKPQRPATGSGGTGMSKTLSSWKKSRGIKSSGLQMLKLNCTVDEKFFAYILEA
jgi:hypothetical protein